MLHHIPNIITSSRIVLAAVFPFCPESYYVLVVFAALATEFLDGFIARVFNWQSYVGQVLDPIADKLFVLSVSLTWVWLGKLDIWQWLLLGLRDFGVAALFIVVILRGQVLKVKALRSRMPSKITTVIQYLVFFIILFNFSVYLAPLVVFAAVMGVIAIAQYIYLLRQSMARDA